MENDYDRWCPMCQCWVPESQTRVRADGRPRHSACDTITLATHPAPDAQMKDLAARMVEDEANEGNYAAAAELQKALTSGTVEVPMSEVPGHAYVAPDHCAKTDPMCPKPMATGSMYCEEHRITARQHILHTVVGRYFDTVHGKLDDTTAEGSAAQDLRNEQIDAAMRLIDLVGGHMLPYKLVNVVEQACEAPAEELERVTDGRESDADAARRFAGQCLELQERIEELEANERTRQFVEKSLDRLKPQLARRIATVIAPETEGMKAGAVILNPERETELIAARERAEAAARRLVEAGLRFVPTDAETELAAKHLRFIVACTKDQSFLQEWDGALCNRADDPELQGDLEDVRERLDSFGQRLSGGAIEPENWGVFGLVRVPDEVVFGKQEADRG
jgi:hypothetical protein